MPSTAKIKEFKAAFKRPSPSSDLPKPTIKALESKKTELEKFIKQSKKKPPLNVEELQNKLVQMKKVDGPNALKVTEHVHKLVAYKLTKHWNEPEEFGVWSKICGDSPESLADPVRRMILEAKSNSDMKPSDLHEFVKECSKRFKDNDLVQQTCFAMVPQAFPKQHCETRLNNLKLDHLKFDKSLSEMIQFAGSFAKTSDYEKANKLLDDIEKYAKELKEKIKNDPANALGNLGLNEVQQVLKLEFPGTKVMSSVVGKFSQEQIRRLLKEKGVSVDSLTERAQTSGRDFDTLLLRAAEFTLCCPEIEKELIEDVAVCSDALRNKQEVLQNFTKLEEQLVLLSKDKKKDDKEYGEHALSQALSQVETKHCFPDINSLPVGILTSETFLGMTSWGYTPKDPGAGLEHGEFTHRLQWNVLMNQFENDKENKSDWNYTPFELFTRIGKTDEESSRKGGGSVWNFMLDAAGSDEALGFASPDFVTGTFKKLAEDQQGTGLKLLSQTVSDRVQKRRENAYDDQTLKAAQEITERLNKELLAHQNAIAFNCPNCRTEFLQWVEENSQYLNMKDAKLDVQSQTKEDGIYAPVFPKVPAVANLAYSLSMEAYKKKKLESGDVEGKTGYKLLDEKNTEDLLLVGTEEEDLTNQEKEDRVIELQSRSREKFGLKSHEFSESDRAVLVRRVEQLTSFQPLASLNDVVIDENELLETVLKMGQESGLLAAIDELEQGKYKEIWTLYSRWRNWSRDLVRKIQRLKIDLKKKEIDIELDTMAESLTEPLTPQLAKVIKSGEFIRILLSAAKDADQKLLEGIKNF